MTKFAITVCVLALAVPTYAQQLTDADVHAAIKAGQAKKFGELVSSCSATAGFGERLLASGLQPTGAFSVVVSLAPGRIAYAAAEAKRLYKPFAIADIPEELRDTSTVFVAVEPDAPSKGGSTISIASPIERIVLKSKVNPAAVAQPLDFTTEPREWSNLVGGKVEANAAYSRYALADVREMPSGDIDIVVITQAGERRCKIGAKDRTNLLTPKT